jgi:hypothetical protein
LETLGKTQNARENCVNWQNLCKYLYFVHELRSKREAFSIQLTNKISILHYMELHRRTECSAAARHQLLTSCLKNSNRPLYLDRLDRHVVLRILGLDVSRNYIRPPTSNRPLSRPSRPPRSTQDPRSRHVSCISRPPSRDQVLLVDWLSSLERDLEIRFCSQICLDHHLSDRFCRQTSLSSICLDRNRRLFEV